MRSVSKAAVPRSAPRLALVYVSLAALLTIAGASATAHADRAILPSQARCAAPPPKALPAATCIEVYADGFINPKGLAFTADGSLYVAEAGEPNSVMVPLPVNFGGTGPVGTNARISRVPPGGGKRLNFVTGLPNIGLYAGVEMLGASGMAVLNGKLYEIAAGHLTVSPKLSLVGPDGKMTAIADVGAFNDANPPPDVNGDAVPLGNPYGMVADRGNLYFTDGNYNRVYKATIDGKLSILGTFQMDPTTTGLAVAPDGSMYVAQFGNAPYNKGTGQIDRIALDGTIAPAVVKNLTTPVGVAFAPDGTLYVLQYASNFSPEHRRYVPGGGAVFRINHDGTASPVVTGLMFPDAMIFGPDGALYVSNYGNESNHGEGQVLRVVVGRSAAKGPNVPAPRDHSPYDANSSSPPSASGSNPAATARVDIVEPATVTQWGYSPKSITIHAGDSVAFTNKGRIAHTVTGDKGAFDTGLIQPGKSAVLTFTKAGTFTYYCQPHPWMKATVVVLPAQAASALKVSIVEPSAVPKWGYAPAKITIHAGQSVTFTNTGRIAHTVTSSTGAFDTGLIQPGKSAMLTFSKPGTYAYYCQPHPWMKATIVVLGASTTPASPTPATPIVKNDTQQPPSVSVGRAVSIVVLIVALVFAAAFALRKRPRSTPR